MIAAGAEEICLKDMAGIGQPALLGALTKAIKTKHPDIIIQYHGHSGPGLSMASILEVCNNGADIIDTAIEPLSWGKVHPDIISVQSMLKNEGFEVADINMEGMMGKMLTCCNCTVPVVSSRPRMTMKGFWRLYTL